MESFLYVLISILVACLLIWLVFYVIDIMAPGFMDPRLRKVLYVLLVLIVLLWALNNFGFMHLRL